jgi:signal transduction histidine kinase
VIVQKFKDGKFNEKIDIISNDELGDFSRSFDSIRTSLLKREKLQNIGDLAARLAHDLRNPLSIIEGATSLLESKMEINENSKKYFKMINSSTKRMTHQLNDVMDFVRISELDLENISLLELLKSTLLKIHVTESIDIQIPQNDIKLKCDPIKLDIVFINLILNAINTIEHGTIKIRFIDENSFVKIEIEDSGPEISLDVMNNMFEPLFTTRSSGTGLGLTSCRNILEQHKGQISVKTNPTVFTLTISKNL